MKILIADDDVISLRLLDATLRHQGHAVTTAADGEEAWTKLQRSEYDVLITDWFMPQLDGFALVRQLRESAHPDTPYVYVILLTVAGGKSNLLSAIDAGVDDFMEKPFDAELLAARLHVAARVLRVHERVHRLEGLLPMCSWCRRMRGEQDNWQSLEEYLSQRTDARVTHGICPDCQAKLVTELKGNR